MPFVASEKKVDAWVVSSLRENVYDDCTVRSAHALAEVENERPVP